MHHYKRIEGKGGVRYLKDSKLFPKDKIRQEVIDILEKHGEYEDRAKFCLFCGQPATKFRLLNLQVVDLCDNDYYVQTMGKIAQRIRENEQAQEETKAVSI